MRLSGQACAYRDGVEGTDWNWQKQQENQLEQTMPHTTYPGSRETMLGRKRIKTTAVWNSSRQTGRATDENIGPAQCEVEMFT